MNPGETQFIQALREARTARAVAQACEALERSGEAVTPAFGAALPAALHGHLQGVSAHPAFRLWLDVFFGRRPGRFRSPLQQPNFLYYPALPAQAWFRTPELPALAPLRDAIPAVREELLGFLGEDVAFQPYVDARAAGDRQWGRLADSLEWSARHLLRREQWDEALVARLPATRGFLEQAPLAQYPPHAPECFISRLKPGTELPPHHGLSNIKLTAHLPVDLPEGCSITVAGETRHWIHGDFLVFDDSFLHSACNRGERVRTVLIFDIWHPGLCEEERAALAHAIAVLDRVQSCRRGGAPS
ncbi:aspartyl/asparaginyl beta-hydroxylase domain-containing protein [Marilutibacter spongiae]|uniref:Aspartyl/asparaginyl beta-hydroxylase domain-containing protein n=1 Tax=Marilutibacter spongiae TaxID=2025720 RepID=A0A7W3TMD0_9GAMM|nr:aspartyl/asparaginyl beta-hydroxylase domain-containing protein [Lysobacter spongiae]MBB1061008.1 aspartyl/asparaginyl beta-hydroxylase domain-containing protein [Lysobacter spongiae]